MNKRSVACGRCDPIQSVKGKVVIDAFRLIDPRSAMMGQEPRQTTSNILVISINQVFKVSFMVSTDIITPIAINYRKNELEQRMLSNLHKHTWSKGLMLKDFKEHGESNEATVNQMLSLAEAYNKSLQEEKSMTTEQLVTRHVGKQDPKRHLEDTIEKGTFENVVQCNGSMLDALSF